MTIIERYREDGEGVRRFFLIAEVTFRDRPADDPEDRNYYADSDLAKCIRDWVGRGVEDRDDLPVVRLHDVPPALHTDMVAVAAAAVARSNTRATSAETDWRGAKDPAALAWGYIIEQNNTRGLDTNDLINALESAGFPCPEGWGE